MPYKDPDKRRDKERDRQRRYRASKSVTDPKGVTNEARISPVVDELDVVGSKEQPRNGVDLAKLNIYAVPNSRGGCKLHAPLHGLNRGLDIKTFADLPPDVQATIEALSDTPQEKGRRTAVAIKYQHLFPDRFYSTGAVVMKDKRINAIT